MSEAALLSDDRLTRIERRVTRERRARLEAEGLLEKKSLELYQANKLLSKLASELELRVEERTRELAVAKERAVRLSERDQLTGLANRMVFASMLCEASAGQVFSSRDFTLLLIDLDKFKEINDTLGHAAGDVLLQEVANRLQSCVAEADVVARIGGDEFAVLCSMPPSSSMSALADRIIAAISRPLDYGGRMLAVSCSIGIACFPLHASDTLDLQRCADLALYRSKAFGGSHHTMFHPAMMEAFNERQILGRDVERALADGDILPWFQPIVDTKARMITGVEALARWIHPDRGVLAPGHFLDLIEERGLMGKMFERMLDASCLAVRPWLGAGDITSLSVNVSPSQFTDGNLAGAILARLRRLDYPPSGLTVEITEDVLVKDLKSARAALEHLAAHGVRIALDDFGAGYSNIAYLRHLPLHRIKLDRMLTAEISGDPKARAALRGVIEMAKGLELDVVAEGVERAEDALLLTKLGCQHLQGYFFGRPMPDHAVRSLAKRVDGLPQADVRSLSSC